MVLNTEPCLRYKGGWTQVYSVVAVCGDQWILTVFSWYKVYDVLHMFSLS